MKRFFANLTLVAYLSAFAWGLFAHTFSVGLGAHPAMYLVVWDMFIGWSYYEKRYQVIGEGESGKYYELDPGPWGEFKPFGEIGRRHYDSSGGHYCLKFGLNTLRHTKHEPISRVYVIEEHFAKKYNLPEFMWHRFYPEPKEPTIYRHVMTVARPDGTLLQSRGSWYGAQYARVMTSNEQLIRESSRAMPLFHFERGTGLGELPPSDPRNFLKQPSSSEVPSPLGE